MTRLPLCRAAAATINAIPAIALLPALAGCSGGQPTGSLDDARSAAISATSPSTVALLVHGMACPKCVSNADLQLLRLPGVSRVEIDMKHGLVLVRLDGPPPSREALTRAISDAGLTLVEIHGLPGEGA